MTGIAPREDYALHLADIAEPCAAFGIDTFNLWLVSLSDRDRDNLESLPTVSEMRPGIEAFERGRRLGRHGPFRAHPPVHAAGLREARRRPAREDEVLVVTPRATFALGVGDLAERLARAGHGHLAKPVGSLFAGPTGSSAEQAILYARGDHLFLTASESSS